MYLTLLIAGLIWRHQKPHMRNVRVTRNLGYSPTISLYSYDCYRRDSQWNVSHATVTYTWAAFNLKLTLLQYVAWSPDPGTQRQWLHPLAPTSTSNRGNRWLIMAKLVLPTCRWCWRVWRSRGWFSSLVDHEDEVLKYNSKEDELKRWLVIIMGRHLVLVSKCV